MPCVSLEELRARLMQHLDARLRGCRVGLLAGADVRLQDRLLDDPRQLQHLFDVAADRGLVEPAEAHRPEHLLDARQRPGALPLGR